MKLKVQLVVCADDGCEEQAQEVVTFEKDCQRIEQRPGAPPTVKQHLVAILSHDQSLAAAHPDRDEPH